MAEMAEIKKKDDLGSLIEEMERNNDAVGSGSVGSKTGYITVEQAADLLQQEETAVRKMMRRGEFRTSRIGRKKFINVDDVRNYYAKSAAEEEIRMADPKRLMTVAEVAATLRFSEAQVYDMLNKKILVGFRIGAGAGSWRVQKSDLDEYIVSQRERAMK
jgi:excisionase family DNA binding protein